MFPEAFGLAAPAFWQGSPESLPARLLSPLSRLYGAAAARRMRRAVPAAAPLPVIVVGGLTAGGDGKTPGALALAELLVAMGERPAFVTRGFGRRRGVHKEPFAVDSERHGAHETGDEALLLARRATTIVGADRRRAASLAVRLGATVLVLDDGLHSRSLEADLILVAVDARYGAGNGLCLPAGPLRAPLASQIAAADAVLIIGEGAAGEEMARFANVSGKPVFRARLAPDEPAAASLRGRRVVGFAGIARPEKFRASLSAIGAEIADFRGFPDHWRYRAGEMSALAAKARRLRAQLVTTEKDATRLAGIATDVPFGVLPVALVFEDEDAIAALLADALAGARRQSETMIPSRINFARGLPYGS